MNTAANQHYFLMAISIAVNKFQPNFVN